MIVSPRLSSSVLIDVTFSTLARALTWVSAPQRRGRGDVRLFGARHFGFRDRGIRGRCIARTRPHIPGYGGGFFESRDTAGSHASSESAKWGRGEESPYEDVSEQDVEARRREVPVVREDVVEIQSPHHGER